MSRADVLESRRYRTYPAMLGTLIALLALIFAEVISPGWACGVVGCPTFILGGNPFLAAALVVAAILAGVLVLVELGVDREGLRETLDDERRVLIKLKAWRNAYFAAAAGLLVFVVLSGTSTSIDMPFLLGAVLVSGTTALYATMVVLDRDRVGREDAQQ